MIAQQLRAAFGGAALPRAFIGRMQRTIPIVARRTVLVLTSVAVTALPLSAQRERPRTPPDTMTLSLASVEELVVRQSPRLLVARQDPAVAGGEFRQARSYRFNPDLAFQSFGSAGAPYELTLMQEIEWAGQRGLRIDAARHGVALASATVNDAARLAIAQASVSFFRTWVAHRRFAVTLDALALTDRLLSAVRMQLAEGEISRMEANLAEIESGRARGRVLAARRAVTSAELALKLQLGLAPDTPIRLADDSTMLSSRTVRALSNRVIEPENENATIVVASTEDSLLALALRRRPDVIANNAAVREASTLTALSRRDAWPNLRIGVAMEGEGSRGIGPAFGLTLPLLNRNRGVIEQRQALQQQRLLDARATALRVRTEVTDALRTYRTATEEVTVYEASVLRPARANVELLETAYSAGKIDLPSLLLLRTQLFDAQLGYWDAWLAHREALIQLESATGGFVPPPTSLRPFDVETLDGSTPAMFSSRSFP